MKKKACLLLIILTAFFTMVLAEAGDRVWSFETQSNVNHTPVVDDDGTLYMGTIEGDLYALNADGTQKWKKATEYRFYAEPVLSENGMLYFCTWASGLVAFDTQGNELWTFPGTAPFSEISLDDDGSLYVAVEDVLYALDKDGELRWQKNLSNCSAPIISEEGLLYVRTTYAIYAYDSDGNLVWDYPICSSDLQPAVADDGTIYFTESGNLYAIAPKANRADTKWIFTAVGNITGAPVVGADGTVYFACDNILYAVSSGGGEKWTYTASSDIRGSVVIGYGRDLASGTFADPFFVTEDYAVYFCMEGGHIQAVSIDGTFLWEASTVCSSCPIITGSNLVYTTGAWNIIKISCDSYGLSKSLWPKSRGRGNRSSVHHWEPENLTAIYNHDTGIVSLSWDNISNSDIRIIEMSTDGSQFEYLGYVESDVCSYDVERFETGDIYYRVWAYNFYNQASIYSNLAHLNIAHAKSYVIPNDVLWGKYKLYVKKDGNIDANDMYITINDDGLYYGLCDMGDELQSDLAFNNHTFTDVESQIKIWLNGELYDTIQVTEGTVSPGNIVCFDGLSMTSESEGGRAMLYETKPGLEKPANTVKAFSVKFSGEGALKIANTLGQNGALLHHENGQWVCVSYGKEELVFDQDGAYAMVNDTEGTYIPRITDSALRQNYPNPFNPETDIDFELEEGGHVKLEIFDSRGRKIVTLADAVYMQGVHTVHWNGKDARGHECASGVYYCRMIVSGKAHTKKMVMLK